VGNFKINVLDSRSSPSRHVVYSRPAGSSQLWAIAQKGTDLLTPGPCLFYNLGTLYLGPYGQARIEEFRSPGKANFPGPIYQLCHSARGHCQQGQALLLNSTLGRLAPPRLTRGQLLGGKSGWKEPVETARQK